MILELLIFGILSIYTVLISYLQFGLSKVKTKLDIESNKLLSQNSHGISIVVAVRNEEKNIENLIRHFLNQDFPKDKFEVIIVDDNSEDKTRSLAKNMLSKTDLNYTIIESDGGKKLALKKGVDQAKFPIIAFTDGDCKMGNLWLYNMEKYFQVGNYQMVSGPVFFEHNNFFERLMALEFASLVVSGAGAIGLNRPIMVNGANLAVRKEAWIKAQKRGTDSVFSSGDDVFIMLEIGKIYGKDKIGFSHDIESQVITTPPKSLSEFFNQRIRWTSKSKSYNDFTLLLVAFIIILTSIAQLVSIILPQFWFFGLPIYYMIFTAIKLFLDMPFINSFLLKYKREKLTNLSPILTIVYPIYILLIAIVGNIVPFNWKNRKLKR